MKENRIHATPLYPGSFMSEEGASVQVERGTPQAVLPKMPDDGRWFGVRLQARTWVRWTDDEGNEKWLPDGAPAGRRYIYIGEMLDAADVKALPGDHEILLSNMRGNRWDHVVRTRRGNFQPVLDQDRVVSEEELARVLAGQPI